LWTITNIANYLRVKPETIRSWARAKKIKGIKLGEGPKADRRFAKTDVMAFVDSLQNVASIEENPASGSSVSGDS
jgi:excisionase family DNA binding protein